MIGCYCHVCTSADPKDQRSRTSALIQTGKTTVVIDTGPDFRMQMLREKVNHLDAVLFTHAHKDHTAGLDDIRPYNYLHGKIIDIYAEEAVQHVLRREFAYIFEGDYPGIPKVNLHTIGTDNFYAGDLLITPIRAMHMELPVLGFRIGNFAYITDASFIPEEEMAKLRGLEVLVINALRLEPHYSHFNFEEALQLIKVLKPGQTYFTHISHNFGRHDEIVSWCPDGVAPGYDGLSFEVS
jgi:phosphoribosyl 1,2-cyclic phosphate phosphodiesterase